MTGTPPSLTPIMQTVDWEARGRRMRRTRQEAPPHQKAWVVCWSALAANMVTCRPARPIYATVERQVAIALSAGAEGALMSRLRARRYKTRRQKEERGGSRRRRGAEGRGAVARGGSEKSMAGKGNKNNPSGE